MCYIVHLPLRDDTDAKMAREPIYVFILDADAEMDVLGEALNCSTCNQLQQQDFSIFIYRELQKE